MNISKKSLAPFFVLVSALGASAQSQVSVSGVFIDPSPAHSTPPHQLFQPQYTGIGSSFVTWGTPAPAGFDYSFFTEQGPLITTPSGNSYQSFLSIVDASGAVETDNTSKRSLIVGIPAGPNAIAEEAAIVSLLSASPIFSNELLFVSTPEANDAFYNTSAAFPFGNPDLALLSRSVNSLTFTGLQVPATKGVPMVVGQLSYRNWSVLLGSEISEVTLRLDTTPVPNSVGSDFKTSSDLKIGIRTSPNVVGDREASADFIFFPDYPEYGSYRVYEGEIGTVEILGEFNSFHLRGFGATDSGGFVNGSTTVTLAAVPEITQVSVFAFAGLVGACAIARKRRANADKKLEGSPS